ncbi:hypothetical protein NP233_g6524 [Leucocoprinus birnbaumii]|uniref:DUF6533 domain-containing protein n=1 Tax=Leucocoprinus birnbaumii TaxID=56174 RepID=A0AAD5VQW5_9AGAR|nr:hypothetical protein NP233_g6524 [Leucocoprinus birnbaumii]
MNPLRATSYIGLAAYAWDWASVFKAEYEFLWRHRLRNLSAAQILYLITRLSPFFCLTWFLYSLVTVCLNYELLLTNLMLRVYALYQSDLRIIWLLVFLTSVKIANIAMSWLLFIPGFEYLPNCTPIVKGSIGWMAVSTRMHHISAQLRKVIHGDYAFNLSASGNNHLDSGMCCHLILQVRQCSLSDNSVNDRTPSHPRHVLFDLGSYDFTWDIQTDIQTQDPLESSATTAEPVDMQLSPTSPSPWQRILIEPRLLDFRPTLTHHKLPDGLGCARSSLDSSLLVFTLPWQPPAEGATAEDSRPPHLLITGQAYQPIRYDTGTCCRGNLSGEYTALSRCDLKDALRSHFHLTVSSVNGMNPLRATSYIGIIAYAWDWASKFNDEYDFVWRKPLWELSAAQSLYLITRYSPFLCHAGHLAMLSVTDRHLPKIPENMCRVWFIFSIGTAGWSYELLLANLMLRVYALYQRDARVAILFLFLTCTKIANIVICWYLFLPGLRYMPNCMPMVRNPLAWMTFSAYDASLFVCPAFC